MKTEKRKVRSDKLVHIKPTIPITLKNCIHSLSKITDQSLKDIGEYLCREGLKSKISIELLSQYFRREYWHGSTLYIGVLSRTSLQNAKLSNQTERITLKFSNEFSEEIKTLAYSLDVTPSKATALLIDVTIKHTDIITSYIKEHVTNNLSYIKVRELKEMLAFMNKSNHSVITWGAFISYLFGEVKDNKVFVSQKIYDLIKEYET